MVCFACCVQLQIGVLKTSPPTVSLRCSSIIEMDSLAAIGLVSLKIPGNDNRLAIPAIETR